VPGDEIYQRGYIQNHIKDLASSFAKHFSLVIQIVLSCTEKIDLSVGKSGKRGTVGLVYTLLSGRSQNRLTRIGKKSLFGINTLHVNSAPGFEIHADWMPTNIHYFTLPLFHDALKNG